MHDNARVHTAGVVTALLAELDVRVMIWPPYSPDLNPIENLWAIMKREVYVLDPGLATVPDTQQTLARLIATAQRAWMAINEAVLRSLGGSMSRRVQAILESRGWYTKY